MIYEQPLLKTLKSLFIYITLLSLNSHNERALQELSIDHWLIELWPGQIHVTPVLLSRQK